MPVSNTDIARAFEEIADLLELAEENPFRIRAYRNAAREIETRSFDIAAGLASISSSPRKTRKRRSSASCAMAR